MTTLLWIIGSGILMAAIALSGSVTLLLDQRTLDKMVLPLVALAAGSLLGGALFHMLPEALDANPDSLSVCLWTTLGFVSFFALEELLRARHVHTVGEHDERPLPHLILIGDGIHNFIGGLAVAGAFLADIRVGIMTWVAAAAHEVPQELGDFGVLVHAGVSRGRALVLNFLSGMLFLVGGLVAWGTSQAIGVEFLLPFAAGNFLYIAAADLVPEIRREKRRGHKLVAAACFLSGLVSLYLLKLLD